MYRIGGIGEGGIETITIEGVSPTPITETGVLSQIEEAETAVRDLAAAGVEYLAGEREELDTLIASEFIDPSKGRVFVFFQGREGEPLLLAVAEKTDSGDWSYSLHEIPPFPEEELVPGWDSGELILVKPDEGATMAVTAKLGEDNRIEFDKEFGRLTHRFNPESDRWEMVEIIEVKSVSELFNVMVETGKIAEVVPETGFYSNWVLGHGILPGFSFGYSGVPIKDYLSAEDRIVALKKEIVRALGMSSNARVGIFFCDQPVSNLKELETCAGISTSEIRELNGATVPESGVFRIGSGGAGGTIKEIFYDKNPNNEIVMILIGGDEYVSRGIAALRENISNGETEDYFAYPREDEPPDVAFVFLLPRDLLSALRQTMLVFWLDETKRLDGPTLRAVLKTRISNKRDSGPLEWGSCLAQGGCHPIKGIFFYAFAVGEDYDRPDMILESFPLIPLPSK